MFYYLADDVRAYREGPFATLIEARRVAREVDTELVPVEMWIECGLAPVWRSSRRAIARITW